MNKIVVSDELFEQLSSLARPFVDKEPADVIRRLVEKELKMPQTPSHQYAQKSVQISNAIEGRQPRERGAVVQIDGTTIHADSVPDLISKFMEYLYQKGKWSLVSGLAPYKTSPQRYLFSKVPKHPNGNDFWVEVKCRDLVVEGHKNYKTAIEQLSKLASKFDMKMSYVGSH